MTNFKLKVHINEGQCEILRGANQSLCIAKCVSKGGVPTANVVWQSIPVKPEVNYEWKNEYMIQGGTNYAVGHSFTGLTNDRTIKYGQQCVFQLDGMLSSPEGAPSEHQAPFKIENNYKTITIGASCSLWSQSPDYVGSARCYVTPQPIPLGSCSIEPMDKVLVWFEQGTTSGYMRTIDTSRGILVDFTDSKSHTISYNSEGHWVKQE